MCKPFMVREDEDLEGTETVSVSLTSRDLTVGERGMIIFDGNSKFFASCINKAV